MLSFGDISYSEVATLLAEESNIISAFHCFEANGESVYGGYIECANKGSDEVVNDYFSSVYDLVVGQIESYDDLVNNLKAAYESSPYSVAGNQTIADTYTYGEKCDDLSINIENLTKTPNIALEDALASAKKPLDQFLLQKEAMDNDEFYIYGIRLVMTGSEIEKLQLSNNVELIEILDFDNNDIITPLSQ